MDELNRTKISGELRERKMIQNNEVPVEYCDVCFIALGSHEKRIYEGSKKFHLDCKNKAGS
jgi:hypothetical protein